MTASIDRDLGAHSARLDVIEKELSEMRTDLRVIRDTLTEARGGWKTLMVVGGMSGTIGAFAAKWVLPLIGIVPK